jgi:DDE superfamily endonuclease
MELTPPFVLRLQQFRPVFTRPSFRLFVHLLTGWTLSWRRRSITECLFTSGHVGDGHWSRYHRFFSHAAWSLDTLCLFLARLLVAAFAPTGTIVRAGDDTLCRKRGLTLYGAGMHHDPLLSSRALKLVSWGHDWVVLALLLPLPRWAPTKVFALSVGFRLYKNRPGLTKGKKKPTAGGKDDSPTNAGGKKSRRVADPHHRTRPELLVELITRFASWFPGREILVTADSAYGGRSVLQKLPPNVHLISQAHPRAALYAPAPPPSPHQKGRRRKKGARLPGMAEWAEDGTRPWETLAFDQFGLHATLQVKVMQALYYKAGKDRLLTLVRTRDTTGKRPDALFYGTLLAWEARAILSTYAGRWALEVTFESSKQWLGLEEPANRLPQAVQRTAPMALVLHRLVVLGFERDGVAYLRFPERPWYQGKKEPSFADMRTTLRRLSWSEKLAQLAPRGSPHEKLAGELAELASRVG